MKSGNEAFRRGAHERAAAHFARAIRIAEWLCALSGEGRVDANCAVKALIESRRNAAENLMRTGAADDACAVLELLFLQICARARLKGAASRKACLKKIPYALEILVSLLERVFAPPAKILSVHAIATEAIAHSQQMEGAA